MTTCALNVAGNVARVFTTLQLTAVRAAVVPCTLTHSSAKFLGTCRNTAVVTQDLLLVGGIALQLLLNSVLLIQTIRTAQQAQATSGDSADVKLA